LFRHLLHLAEGEYGGSWQSACPQNMAWRSTIFSQRVFIPMGKLRPTMGCGDLHHTLLCFGRGLTRPLAGAAKAWSLADDLADEHKPRTFCESCDHQ
jgi:hypothetical protein